MGRVTWSPVEDISHPSHPQEICIVLEMPRAAFIAALEDHPEDFVLEIVGMGLKNG